MPNYEYECCNCAHKFIEFQTMSENRLVKCPECKKNKLERLISGGGGVVFKGSGFYETDYKKGNSEKPTSSDKNSKSELEPSASKKTTEVEKPAKVTKKEKSNSTSET